MDSTAPPESSPSSPSKLGRLLRRASSDLTGLVIGDDGKIVQLLERSKARYIVLTHLSRRTHLAQAHRQINDAIKPEDRERLFLLMDHRSNRDRYNQQQEAFDTQGD